MKIRSKILEITYLAMLCETIGFHCFVSYSPHVNQCNIMLHDGKWKSRGKSINTEFYLNDDKKTLSKADRVIYQLKSILKKNKINYEQLMQVERIEYDYTF